MTITLKLSVARPEPGDASLPPCAGHADQWQDTTSLKQMRRTAEKCRSSCGVLEWCERERQAAAFHHGAVYGVWAGQVYDAHGRLAIGNPPQGGYPQGTADAA